MAKPRNQSILDSNEWSQETRQEIDRARKLALLEEQERRKKEEQEWKRMRQAEGKPLAPDSPFRTESAWGNVESNSASTEAVRARPLDSSSGYDPLADIGVSARQGAASVTKGAIGLPVNFLNTITAPSRGLLSLLDGDDRTIEQPEIVRGVRESIDDQQKYYYDTQASNKLKQKNLDFQQTDGLWDTAKFLAQNPGYLGLQGVQQAPQLLAGGGAPGVVGKVLLGAANAAGQTEEAASKILRDAGMSEDEIAKRTTGAFASSFALNAALPFAAKSTFLEGLVSGVAGNRVTSGVLKDVLSKTSREVIEGVSTEVGDQFIQNVAAKRPLDEGLAQAAILGAAFSTAVAGPAATLQSAQEAGRAASQLAGYLNDKSATNRAKTKLQEEWAAARTSQAPLTQLDMFGGGGQQEQTAEPAPQGSAIGTDSEGNQQMLRTRAAAIEAQLEQDRARLQGFQTRIEQAPFTEGQEDTLTKGERTDMSRLQDRIALQENALNRAKAAIVPQEQSLGLNTPRQPKRPKFTGEPLTVEPQAVAPIVKAPVVQAATAAPVEGEAATVDASTLTQALEGTPEGSVALPAIAAPTGPRATLDDVGKAVGGGKRDALASRLSYMIEDGNLEIVQDQADIAELKDMKQQGKGWYHPKTGKTYIVAGNLDAKNVRGDLLSTLAHETKHGGDFGGSKNLARSFKGFIGSEANTALADKIKDAATKGDTSAAYAIKRVSGEGYTSLGLNADQTNSEIVANYISAESKKGGITTSLYRGVVSPLRAGARKLIRSKEVSLGDISYMADQLVGEVAGRGERFTGNVDGKALPMFAGAGSKTANIEARDEAVSRLAAGEDPEIVRQETGWEKGTDGKMFYEFADDQAVIKPEFFKLYPRSKPMKLGDVLDHPKLFEAYPWAKLIPVTRKQGSSDTVMAWMTQEPLAMNITPANNKPLSSMLHEIQHVVQGYENFAAGGNQNAVFDSMSDEQKTEAIGKLIEQAKEDGNREAGLAEMYERLDALEPTLIAQAREARVEEQELLKIYQKMRDATKEFTPEVREAGNRWMAAGDITKDLRQSIADQVTGNLDPRDVQIAVGGVIFGNKPKDSIGLHQRAALLQQEIKAGLESGDPDIVQTALTKADAFATFYTRLAGEVQARTTQLRRKMTEEDRKETSQLETRRQKREVMPEDEIVISREQDSNEEPSGLMPSLAEEESDNRSWWNKRKDNSAGVRVLDDALSTTGGFGIDLFKIFDQRQGLRGDLSLRAEAIFDKADKALKAITKERRISSKALSSEIEAKLTEINKNPNRDEREAAVRELDEDYPGVGTALSELRDLKWSLARGVIQQRAAQGGELTAKEQNIFGAIIKNAETYTTRAYLANQVNSKRFAKERLKDIVKNPEGEDAAKFEQALDFITRRHLAIPTREELDNMKGAEIRKFYEQWIGDSKGLDVTEMADELAALPPKSTDTHRKEAIKIAEELMGLRRSSSATARSYGGSRQNRTILEGRENVPDEIRFLMGEITNPIATEMMSIARLINLYTQTKMLQDMVSIGKDRFYKDSKDGDFSILLKSETYGPMNGKWVTPTASKFLEPAVSISLNIEQALSSTSKDMGALVAKLMDGSTAVLRATTGAVKMVDLITSPAAMAWNYMGAYVIMAQNGVINPALALKSQRATWRAIRAHNDPSKFKPEQLEEIQELVRSRVLDSATVGEFQQSLYENMFRMLENEQNESDITRAIARGVKDGSMQMRDAYAFMDMWAKVAAYYDRRDYLTGFYAAEGSTKTAREIELEAGQDVTAANISYTRAFNIIKKAERNIPMFTMYLTYFSEVPRSLVASSFLAVADFKRAAAATTPEGKALAMDAGMRRAAGTFAATAVITALVANALEGLSDDEKRRRETDPEWEQKGIPIPVGKTKDGKSVTINILRADPNGPMNEFMVRLASMSEDEDVGEIMLATLKSQFVQAKPVMSVFRLIKGAAGFETKNFEDDHGKLADWLDDRSVGDDTNLGRNFMAVVEGFTPRIIKGSYRSLNDTIGNRQHEYDADSNPAITALQSIGATPNVRDPEFSLDLSASAYNRAKKDTTSKLAKIKDRFPRLDGNQLIDQIAPIVESEEEAYRKLWKVYDGTKAFNGYYTDKDYAKAAKEIIKSKKLGAVSKDLDNNTFNVRFIPDKYIKEWRTARETANKEIKNPTEKSKAAAALRKEYKLVTDYLSAREEENK